MPANGPAERREYRRLTLPLSARFKLRNSRVVRRGTIENISGVGAAILTPVPLPENAIVEQLRFSLPPENGEGNRKMSIAAGVVTSEQQAFAVSSERYRSGLVFLGLAGGQFETVCEIIDRELRQSCRGLAASESPT